MTLASVDPHGAWASTVNYVPLREPLRLLWYSLRSARHSRNLESHSFVSGSIYLTGLPGLGLDGAQFEATARCVATTEIDEMAAWYYQRNFTDHDERERWRLPLDQFHGSGPRRFYVATIRAWWLLDIDRWLRDMHDQRISVPLESLSSALGDAQ